MFFHWTGVFNIVNQEWSLGYISKYEIKSEPWHIKIPSQYNSFLNIQKLEHELGFHTIKSDQCWRCQSKYDPDIEGTFYK